MLNLTFSKLPYKKPVIIFIQLMLSVSLGPKVITFSGFHCNSYFNKINSFLSLLFQRKKKKWIWESNPGPTELLFIKILVFGILLQGK